MGVSPRILFALKVALSAFLVIQTGLLIIVTTLLQVSRVVPAVLISGMFIDVVLLTMLFLFTRGQSAP